jgi:hypothetical protein
MKMIKQDEILRAIIQGGPDEFAKTMKEVEENIKRF